MNTVASNRRILPIAVWATLFALFLLACYVVSYPIYMRWRFGTNPAWDTRYSSVQLFAPIEFVMDRSQSVTGAMIWMSEMIGAPAVRLYRLQWPTLNVDQRLIVACYHVDLAGVRAALKDGANPNGRFGYGNADDAFHDPLVEGSLAPVSAAAFTPLLALGSSLPDPPPIHSGAVPDADVAKIPDSARQKRVQNGLEILKLLLAEHAQIDAEDGWGSTALFFAVYLQKLELATALVAAGANVNTRTGVYIDGPGDITPLHYSHWSAELAQLLIDKGADPLAKDSDGRTPLDWAEGQEAEAVLKRYTRKP